ncbi:hypothetical protein GCM10010390_52020 [Streptomyces mordarskii]|uniref:Uncharacterized protein n=1 Tax=Streptomyces mordarskii TaxID=1226758 RepID=A0ABN1DH66_9ACTN
MGGHRGEPHRDPARIAHLERLQEGGGALPVVGERGGDDGHGRAVAFEGIHVDQTAPPRGARNPARSKRANRRASPGRPREAQRRGPGAVPGPVPGRVPIGS